MFHSFPRSGGWVDQDDREILSIRIVDHAEHIFSKLKRNEKLTVEDSDFIGWVESNGD